MRNSVRPRLGRKRPLLLRSTASTMRTPGPWWIMLGRTPLARVAKRATKVGTSPTRTEVKVGTTLAEVPTITTTATTTTRTECMLQMECRLTPPVVCIVVGAVTMLRFAPRKLQRNAEKWRPSWPTSLARVPFVRFAAVLG